MTNVLQSDDKKQTKVWALYRVSSDKQGGEGDDIPTQKAICREFAEKQGWTIENELFEKLSGFNTPLEEREKLTEIKQGALKGDFDVLLVYHSDRLGRGMEYTFFLQILYQLGVQVWSARENELKSGEHQDSLLNFIKFWNAEGESRKISMRVKDTFKQLNEEGNYYLGGTVPLGYTLVDTGEKRNSKSMKTLKKLIVNNDEAEIVKLIYSLALNKGWGGNRIANYLNDQGVTNSGEKWKHKRIVQILRNSIYMGRKRFNITKTIPRSNQRERMSKEQWKLQPFNPDLVIVSQEDWFKVQELMTNRNNQDVKEKRNRKGKSQPTSSCVLFSGLTHCGICQTPMYTNVSYRDYTNKSGETTKHVYYRYECPHKADVKHEQARWSINKIDEFVEGKIIEQIESINLEAFQLEDNSELEEMDSRKVLLKELQSQLKDKTIGYANTEKLFNDVMEGKVNLDITFVTKKMQEFHDAKEEIAARIIQVEEEIKQAEITTNDIDKLKNKLSTWVHDYKTKTDLDEKKMMLHDVIDKIYIHKQNGKTVIDIKFNLVIENVLQEVVPEYEEICDENVDGQAPDTQPGRYDNLLQKLQSMGYAELAAYKSMTKAISFSHTITR